MHDLEPDQLQTFARATPAEVGCLLTSSLCGAQLAEPVGAVPDSVLDGQTTEHLLGLRKRLLKILDPTGPAATPSVGWLIPAADYFADLRALLGLVFLSWPAARSFAAPPALADAFDCEAEERLARAAALRDRPGKKHSPDPLLTPPLDPLLMGAVLGIAERLLGALDEERARELMLPLIHQASRVDQALSIYLRREAWVSFPPRIVSMNRSESMMAMGDIITRGPVPKGGSGPCSEGHRRREPW
ncbi:hypothetical protein ABTY53_21820 [Streptomyces noursei]|uniref:hypothetical protein n=1 Tax=Streptomyces noursei TaxID=1971 RepID=UPI00332B28FA